VYGSKLVQYQFHSNSTGYLLNINHPTTSTTYHKISFISCLSLTEVHDIIRIMLSTEEIRKYI